MTSKVFRILIVLLIITIVSSTLGAKPTSAATLSVCPTCAYTTIQSAINAAAPGDTIAISAGTYNENININKRIQLIGAGSSTIITQTAAGAGDSRVGVVQLNASGLASAPILIQNLRIEPVGLAGISVGRFTEATGTAISYITLDNVQVIGTNTSPSTEQERGLYVDLTSTLEHLEVTDCAFDNLTYGWYLHKQVSADASNVRYIQVTNTTFNHNNHKGIYAEKLSDAVFTRCTADQNGYDSSILPSYFQAWSAGIDINLKAGIYTNITFENCTVTNNAVDQAKEGVGLTVKARDDGGTYGAFPASLNNVSIISGTYANNERGIRIGEPGKNNASPTNVLIHNLNIYNNTQHYSGSDGSTYGDVVNQLGAGLWVDATGNWWGNSAGPYDGTGTQEAPPCTSSPASEININGVGNGVNDRVDYCPWLSSAPSPPVVIDTIPADGSSLATGPTQLQIEYNKDVKNDGSAGAANNPSNYILVEEGGDGFQTVDCSAGSHGSDIEYPIAPITYSNNGGAGPYIATLTVNGGAPLPAGSYRLYICGTTSIEDLYGIELNDGAFDTGLDFNIGTPASLPATGFPLGQVAADLSEQPPEKEYTSNAAILEIPSIDLSLPIVGVPQSEDSWDVTWLGENAGYLAGSAFPTWAGNTVITGHVWNSLNQPGAFANLKSLKYGDQIHIRVWGQTYTYEVRESKLVLSADVNSVFRHEEYDWVTLVTCELFNPLDDSYLFRRVVRAVLVSVR